MCYNGFMLLDLIYGLVLIISLPFMATRWLSRDRRRHFLRRFSPGPMTSKRSGKRIWIHAVSVGEVRGIAHLIHHIHDTLSKNLVLTVTTLSGYRCAREIFPEMDVFPAPLDFSFTVRAYLKHLNPHLLMFNELEIWPNWTRLARNRGVPILVINARISDSAFRRYRRFNRLFRAPFSRPNRWMVQSALYVPRFKSLGIPENRIRVSGNIKADQALEASVTVPAEAEVFSGARCARPSRPLVVLASTHAEDEAVLFPALASMRDRPAVIIVPRHPGRAGEISRALDRLTIPHAIWSRIDAIDLDTRVLIYDRIGFLFPLMSVSDRVFMGGTFSPRTGGHNLYEPAVLGCSLFGGPHYNNFPDIGASLVAAGAYRVIHNPEDAQRELSEKTTAAEASRRREAAHREVELRRGSTERILEEIRQCLD